MTNWAKRRTLTLFLVKIGVDGAIKKPRQALTLAVAPLVGQLRPNVAKWLHIVFSTIFQFRAYH